MNLNIASNNYAVAVYLFGVLFSVVVFIAPSAGRVDLLLLGGAKLTMAIVGMSLGLLILLTIEGTVFQRRDEGDT